jgi:hypothetical protein
MPQTLAIGRKKRLLGTVASVLRAEPLGRMNNVVNGAVIPLTIAFTELSVELTMEAGALRKLLPYRHYIR